MRDFQGNLGKINLVDKKICCNFPIFDTTGVMQAP